MPITVGSCPGNPILSATKSLTSGTIAEGETVTYTVTVYNTGDTVATGVLATDSLSPITVGVDTDGLFGAGATIAAGGSSTATYDYVVTTADASAGFILNTVTVTSNEGQTTQARESVVIASASDAMMTLKKTGVVGGTGAVGDTVTYSFEVENTGSVDISNVTITDPLFTVTGTLATLAAGATDTSTFSGTYTITQTDVDNGFVSNQATASGEDPSGGPVSAVSDDPADLTGDADPTVLDTIAESPSLDLLKTATVNGTGAANDTISYMFQVTNTGNVTVNNITISDPLFTVSGGPISLAPGAVDILTFTGTYTISNTDASNGSVTNSATASGTTVQGTNVSQDSRTSADAVGTSNPLVTPLVTACLNAEMEFATTAGSILDSGALPRTENSEFRWSVDDTAPIAAATGTVFFDIEVEFHPTLATGNNLTARFATSSDVTTSVEPLSGFLNGATGATTGNLDTGPGTYPAVSVLSVRYGIDVTLLAAGVELDDVINQLSVDEPIHRVTLVNVDWSNVTGLNCPGGAPGFTPYEIQATPLGVSKSAVNTSSISEGTTSLLRIRMRNLTGAALTNVVLTDTLPAGITYVPGSMMIENGTGTISDAGPLVATFPSVAIDEEASATFLVEGDTGITPGSTITNSVTVTADGQASETTDLVLDVYEANKACIAASANAPSTGTRTLEIGPDYPQGILDWDRWQALGLPVEAPFGRPWIPNGETWVVNGDFTIDLSDAPGFGLYQHGRLIINPGAVLTNESAWYVNNGTTNTGGPMNFCAGDSYAEVVVREYGRLNNDGNMRFQLHGSCGNNPDIVAYGNSVIQACSAISTQIISGIPTGNRPLIRYQNFNNAPVIAIAGLVPAPSAGGGGFITGSGSTNPNNYNIRAADNTLVEFYDMVNQQSPGGMRVTQIFTLPQTWSYCGDGVSETPYWTETCSSMSYDQQSASDTFTAPDGSCYGKATPPCP